MGNERRNRKWEKMGKWERNWLWEMNWTWERKGMNNKKCYLFCDTHSLV
jgi:hypothetical protein